MKTEGEIFSLCDEIREVSFALHKFLRHGHLEKVYENGLAHRLRQSGKAVLQQHALQVKDRDGTILGDYLSDLFVENCLVIEVKTCRSLAEEHVAQLLGYLRSSRVEHGLLLNFGPPVFQIRKFILSNSK